MIDIDELTIGEAKTLAGMFGLQSKKETSIVEKNHGIRIAILQRGWVVVGTYIERGDYIEMPDGAVVRQWGTTGGLPELAAKGPLPNTKLDKGAKVRFLAATEIASLDCSETSWQGNL